MERHVAIVLHGQIGREYVGESSQPSAISSIFNLVPLVGKVAEGTSNLEGHQLASRLGEDWYVSL